MTRYIVLLNFLEQGFGNVADSPSRAEQFRSAAAELGAKVEWAYWTLGPYDGAFVLSAPDDATAAALTLKLGRDGNVRTTMLRAFDADEFHEVLGKVTS